MSAGIDYGMGHSNVDPETGIRYGVISQHSVTQAWCETSEPDYGDPHCPQCGGDVVDGKRVNDAECVCTSCDWQGDSSECYSDEPIGWTVDDGEITATDCLDSDIMVLKSLYYTFARFCSPCVPGAGNLDDHDPDGVKTYCLPHNWFECGKAPYPVYRVDDDSLVEE